MRKETRERLVAFLKEHRYSTSFFLSFLCDMIISFNSWSFNHGWVWSQSLVSFMLPFINLISFSFYVEAQSFQERLKLTFVNATAYSLGSTVTLLAVRR
jgi:hypothetical protein